MLLSFSEYFQISLNGEEDWFNPIIIQDTKLFIDPFLVDKFGNNIPEFESAHDNIIKFFNGIFLDAARLSFRSESLKKPLLRSLTFPETNELYLGYAKRGNTGAGSAKGFAKLLLDAIFDLIDHGIKNITRFEELELFSEGFGADRIGDMMGILLKQSLVAYTQRICSSLNIELKPCRMKYMYLSDARVWQDSKVELPCVLSKSKEKYFILLVPKCFLRHLPSIDVEDFWDFCYSNENDSIRAQFGDDIKRKVDRKKMFQLARRAEDLRKAYLENLKSKHADPYDLTDDPELLRKWYDVGKYQSLEQPYKFNQPKNQDDFNNFISQLITRFSHFIEERGGWRLLRDDSNGKGKKEAVVQRLFDGIILAYCEANDIDYSPEVDAGRGPVDFKFSSGYSNRIILEIKLARNTQLLDGLKSQLPSYLKTHMVDEGFLLVILYEESDIQKVNDLRKKLPDIEKEFNIKIHIVVVDALEKKSASKIKS